MTLATMNLNDITNSHAPQENGNVKGNGTGAGLPSLKTGATVKNIAPLTFVACEEDTDLRTVSWSEEKLWGIKEEYGLGHGQCVYFRNVAQDKARLVVCWFGMPVLLLLPVNYDERLSLDLKVNLFLRKFHMKNAVVESFIEEQIRTTQDRIALRKKREDQIEIVKNQRNQRNQQKRKRPTVRRKRR